MNFSKLETIICDLIKEEQVKLGYQKETIRLYFPLQSLNHYVGGDYGKEEIYTVLNAFADNAKERLGNISFSNSGERFCICLPPEASEYVHRNTAKEGFLYDFVATIAKHGVTLEELLAVFHQYSNQVTVEKADHGEFDYLVYFTDGKPDDYRYCLHNEGHHMIYHRYSLEDYQDLNL